MKEYQAEQIRNVGLFSHGGAGKTSLAEALLFQSGAITRLGRVEEGSATTDYDPDEIKRHISVSTALAPCEWQGHKVNVLDTPGYADFIGEVVQAMRVVDGAVILLDAVSGLEVGTETVWQEAEKNGVPRMFFVNKMERENANFDAVVRALRNRFGKSVVALQIPVGSEQNFKGVVDLLTMTAITDEGAREVTGDLRESAEAHRETLVETVVEVDDDLINKYLEGEEISVDELKGALQKGVRSNSVFPVMCGSALTSRAIAPLLDAAIAFMPNPMQATVRTVDGDVPAKKLADQNRLAALVWKTVSDPYVGRLNYFRVYSGVVQSDSHVWNPGKGREERIGQLYMLIGKKQEPVPRVGLGDIGAVAKLQETATGDTLTGRDNPVQLAGIEFPAPVFSAAIAPKTKADLDKLGPALSRMTEEDPTIRVEKNTETAETIMSGMGESHVDITAERMKRKFGVDVEISIPKVAYRETVTASAKAQGRYKKQTGGHGQFGDTWLEVEPLPRGADTDFEFADRIVGGAVPKNFIPAVEKGVREALREGVLAGFPMTGLRVILYDGSYHPVDSSEMSFKIAASLGFKKAASEAKPVLLEPVVEMEITVPDSYTGDIIGDLNTKRAQVLGMVPSDGFTTIQARAPYAEVRRYATDLRSITGARGRFTMQYSGYEEVPAHVAQQVIAEAKKEREQEK